MTLFNAAWHYLMPLVINWQDMYLPYRYNLVKAVPHIYEGRTFHLWCVGDELNSHPLTHFLKCSSIKLTIPVKRPFGYWHSHNEWCPILHVYSIEKKISNWPNLESVFWGPEKLFEFPSSNIDNNISSKCVLDVGFCKWPNQ